MWLDTRVKTQVKVLFFISVLVISMIVSLIAWILNNVDFACWWELVTHDVVEVLKCQLERVAE